MELDTNDNADDDSVDEDLQEYLAQSAASGGTELEKMFADVEHIITCLYRISVNSRNPTSLQRIKDINAVDMSCYTQIDITHARQRFGNSPEWLIRRLGRANTKRRQLLQYFRMEHFSFKTLVSPTAYKEREGQSEREGLSETDSESQKAGSDVSYDAASSILSSHLENNSRELHTTVSSYMDATENVTIPDVDHVLSEVTSSQSSNAPSDSPHIPHITVPPPPGDEEAYGSMPFCCPYCYEMVKVKQISEWEYVTTSFEAHARTRTQREI